MRITKSLYGQRNGPLGIGPQFVFAAAISGRRCLLDRPDRRPCPRTSMMPWVATLLLVFAAGLAVVAWRRRGEDPTRVTYADVAGALDADRSVAWRQRSTQTKWCASSTGNSTTPMTGDHPAPASATETETPETQQPNTLNTSPGPSGSANAAMSDWNIQRSGPHESANQSGCDRPSSIALEPPRPTRARRTPSRPKRS